MRSRMAVLAMSGWLAFATSCDPKSLDFEDETTRINYSLGYQIGGDFRRQEVALDAEAVVQGIADALEEAEPRMSPEEMSQTLVALKRRIVADARSEKQRQAERMRTAGQRFLAQNRQQEGVRTTASGLQYKVVEEGSGRSPGPGDTVTVHYRGTLISGQVFDSTRKRGEPATLSLSGVVPGFGEGLQLMKEGGRYELYVPPELAYDREGPMADHTLIYEVELLSVE